MCTWYYTRICLAPPVCFVWDCNACLHWHGELSLLPLRQAEVFGKHLTSLASLRLPGCGITDFDLLGLRPLTALTLLDLGDATEVCPCCIVAPCKKGPLGCGTGCGTVSSDPSSAFSAGQTTYTDYMAHILRFASPPHPH